MAKSTSTTKSTSKFDWMRSGFNQSVLAGLVALLALLNTAVWWRTSAAISPEQLVQMDFAREGFDGPVGRVLHFIAQDMLGEYLPWMLTAHGRRLIVALMATASLTMLYICARNWFWQRSSLIVALIMATGFWTYVVGRFYVDSIETLFLVSLMLFVSTKAHYTKKHSWVAAWALTMVYSLYVPYGALILLATLLALPGEIYRFVSGLNVTSYAVGLLVMVAGVVPLGYSLYRRTTSIESLLPFVGRDIEPSSLLNGAVDGLSAVFVRRPEDWQYGISVAPMINVVLVAMCLVGLLHLGRHVGAVRTRLLMSLFVVALLVSAVEPSQTYNVLFMPLVVLFASLGLAIVTREWHNLFPRNPAAHVAGLVPIVLLLVLTVLFDQYKAHRSFSLSSRVVDNYPLAVDVAQSDADILEGGRFVSFDERSVASIKAFYNDDSAQLFDASAVKDQDVYWTDRQSLARVKAWLGGAYVQDESLDSRTSMSAELFRLSRVE